MASRPGAGRPSPGRTVAGWRALLAAPARCSSRGRIRCICRAAHAAAHKTRPTCTRWHACRPRPTARARAGARVRCPVHKRRFRAFKLRPRIQRPNGLHCLPGNHNRRFAVPRRQCVAQNRWMPVHSDQRHGFIVTASTDGRTRTQMRGHWRAVTAIAYTDVRDKVTTAAPPGGAASSPWHPTPTEAIVVVPIAALKRQIAPRIARYPNVAKARRPHPVTAPVRVPSRAGCRKRRPDVALPRHVVPGPVRVQVVPRRVAAVGVTLSRPSLRRRLGGQHLVAIGVP